MIALPPLPDHRMEALRALDSLGALYGAFAVAAAQVGDRADLDAGQAWLALTQLCHQGFVSTAPDGDRDDPRRYALTASGKEILAGDAGARPAARAVPETARKDRPDGG